MARGTELALTAEERTIVDGEEHTHRRLVDGDGWQRLGVLEVGDGVANLETLETDNGTDVARAYLVGLLVTHTLKGMQLLDLGLLLAAVAVTDGDVHTIAQHATMHAAHGDTTRIAAIIERSDKHLGRSVQLAWSRNLLEYLVEQIFDIVGRLGPVCRHPTVLGRAINDREIELVFGGVEVAHKVEHHLIDLLGTAVGFVYLVDHHDGLQAQLQRLLQHKSGLGHRALKGVDEQQTAVGHIEHTLYLATEVGVTRRVEDIYLNTFPVDRNVFGEDGDTALTFQIVSIQHLTTIILALTEEFSGEHHLVDQRSFSVVDVCNHCNIPNVLHQMLP